MVRNNTEESLEHVDALPRSLDFNFRARKVYARFLSRRVT